MKDLRYLKDLTIHDVKPVSDEQSTGRRHSLRVLQTITSSSSSNSISAGGLFFSRILIRQRHVGVACVKLSFVAHPGRFVKSFRSRRSFISSPVWTP